MRTATTLGAFGAGLAVAFAAALGLGSAVGPVGAVGAVGPVGAASAASPAPGEADQADQADAVPGGLVVAQHGYALDLVEDTTTAGAEVPVAFRLLGPDGAPVTDYTPSHDEDLHLIAVRRDTTGFQHVHPALAADGTWSTPLDLTAGDWRIFADSVPAAHGETLVLGADLAVAGAYDPRPLPQPAATAQVDGYAVALDGELVPGQERELTLSVSKDGQPVTDLQPYLAAYGHLVALREGDLAYLHVHPEGEPGDGSTPAGPQVTFSATAPSGGDYRLFLDFKHGDVVRTAEFTVRADAAPAAAEPPADAPADAGHGGGHDH